MLTVSASDKPYVPTMYKATAGLPVKEGRKKIQKFRESGAFYCITEEQQASSLELLIGLES